MSEFSEIVGFIKKDARVKDLIAEFLKGKKHFIVLDENGKYYGIIPEHLLIRISLNFNEKINKFIIKVTPLNKEFSLEEALEKFVSTGSRILPIQNEKGEIVDIISIYDILPELMDKYPEIFNKKVSDIMNENVITIYEKEPVIKALILMKEKGVSRLIVVNEFNKIVGIITIGDIIRRILPKLIDLKENVELGTFYEKEFAVEVRSIYTSDVITVRPDNTVKEAAKIMVDNIIFGVPVEKNKRPLGMLTLKDILAKILAHIKRKDFSLIIHGINLDEEDIRWLRTRLERLVKKYESILGKDISFIFHIKKIRERHESEGTMRFFTIKAHLISSNVKIYSDIDTIELYSGLTRVINIFKEKLEKIKHKKERDWFIEWISKESPIF